MDFEPGILWTFSVENVVGFGESEMDHILNQAHRKRIILIIDLTFFH